MMTASVYQDFRIELTRSEWQRARLMVGALVAGTLIVLGNYFLLDDQVIDRYGGPLNYWLIVGWLAFFTVVEGFVLWHINRRLKLGRPVGRYFKYFYTVIEVTLPSALIFYMIEYNHLLVFLDSAVVLTYFLFIILTVLHLDLKINLLAGVLSAAQYALVVYYSYHFVEPNEFGYPNLPENSLYLRSVVMIICGVAAGFVSEEVKRRVRSYLDTQNEKGRLEELFGQQVSPAVLNTLIRERDQIKKAEATVLALDVRNFTAFAEHHAPDEIQAYQNKLFGPILEIINQHQGIVNQIMGDGLMATFGTPVENALHADMAFQAAVEIRRRVRLLGEAGEIPNTRIGIGLHTGEVVFGNIGNDRRKQFSISGTAVIIAFRVEQRNKDLQTEILLTRETHEQITVGRRNLVARGPQALKGFGRDVEVYQVV